MFSVKVESGFSLINIICVKMRNSWIVGYILDLMIVNLLGKELVEWDVVLFVKS